MNKRHLRIVCTLTACCMAAGISGTAALAAESPEYAAQAPSVLSEEAFEIHYSDSFFLNSSEELNPQMMMTSMVLSVSASEDGGGDDIAAELSGIGFEDIEFADMNAESSADTVGSVIARKQIGDETAVAVIVRGTAYGAEWCSNLTAGTDGDAKGFSDAAGKISDRILAYISSRQLDSVKLWMTGYSRGAAVADLTAVRINQNLSDFRTSAESLYVYAFEPPRCSASDETFGNIFCIRNKNDLVTYVYPEGWGLYTNGTDIVIGEDLTVEEKKVVFTDSNMVKSAGSVPMDAFLQEFSSFLSENLDRADYAGDCQQAAVNLMALFQAKSGGEVQHISEFLSDLFWPAVQESVRFKYILMYDLLNGIVLHNSDLMYQKLSDEISLLLDEVLSELDADIPFTDSEIQIVKDALYPILRAFGPCFVADYRSVRNPDCNGANVPENYDDPDYNPDEDISMLHYDFFKSYLELSAEEEAPSANERENSASALTDSMSGTEAPSEAAIRAAEADAYMDAAAGPDGYHAHYSPVPQPSDGVTYSKLYLLKYRAAYSERYESCYQSARKEINEIPLYHFATLILNFDVFVSQHMPAANYALIQAIAAEYEAPAQTTVTETVQQPAESTVTESLMPVVPEIPQIASDSELCAWAEKDFSEKHGTAVTAEITAKDGSRLTLTLYDASGQTADIYRIDVYSGYGTDSDAQTVDLPQTGRSSVRGLLLLTAAFLSFGFGLSAVLASGILRRKRSHK